MKHPMMPKPSIKNAKTVVKPSKLEDERNKYLQCAGGDPIGALVQSLEKKKYLQYAGGTKTVETHSHELIAELDKVKCYRALSLVVFLTSLTDV
jgi:hypothetical protein